MAPITARFNDLRHDSTTIDAVLAEVEAALEASRRALKTDRIPVYQQILITQCQLRKLELIDIIFQFTIHLLSVFQYFIEFFGINDKYMRAYPPPVKRRERDLFEGIETPE